MCTGKHCVLDTMCTKFGHILIQTVLLQFQIKRAPADTQQLGSGFPVVAGCFQCFQNSCPFRSFIVQRIAIRLFGLVR